MATPNYTPAAPGRNDTRTPAQNKSRNAVRKAISEGRMKVPHKCSQCGAKKSYGKGLEFAHSSYAKKDGIKGKFKCRTCHRKSDAKHGKARKGAARVWKRSKKR